jgi:hypothetical protein
MSHARWRLHQAPPTDTAGYRVEDGHAAGVPAQPTRMNLFPTSANPPAARRRDEQQEPLGSEPSYDDVLDVAVQYTFPCSDPIAVEACCKHHPERDEGQPKGPGRTPGHGNFIEL